MVQNVCVCVHVCVYVYGAAEGSCLIYWGWAAYLLKYVQ